MSLEGMVFVITGGSTGIGAATAAVAAESGARVVIGSRNAERGNEVGKTLSVGGGGAGGGEMTAAKLLAMSNDEFDAWTSRNPAKAKRLMGGWK